MPVNYFGNGSCLNPNPTINIHPAAVKKKFQKRNNYGKSVVPIR
jgi:hypothetical protein